MPASPKTERFKIEKFKNPSGNTSYRVTGYKPDGERIRKNFRYRADAIEYRANLEKECLEGKHDRLLVRTKLSAEQIADAETALSHTAESTLTEQILELQSLRQRVAKVSDVGLENAIAFFESHYKPEISKIGVYLASEKFIASRTGRSEKTKAYYSKCLKLLSKDDPNTAVHEFTTRSIEEVLSPYKHIGTQRSYRRGLNAFFNWAVRAKYCLENPCDHMEALPQQRRKVVILPLSEVKQLLKASCDYKDGSMASSIALMLFAGLRPSELEALKPEDVRSEYLIISGGKMEGKIKRRVPIAGILETWLKKYPFQGRPINWVKKMQSLKNAIQPTNWVSDILRHTSISYQVERDEDIGKVATRNGTSSNMVTLHYRDVIEDPQDVIEFWSMSPEAVEDVKLKGKLPEKHTVLWPDDAALKKLVWEKPLSHLAKDLGSSDNAIRKRCLKRGIELPKNGHWQRVRAS
ncbi:tyrosine-type recombinase/integrase [Cerasicoccus maritimus]|uniref:tyrosine-type recombinase/integrase n=1 Tax=Cerasicoccus maritimus TaxID=490089 RepID=UPI002852549B|nr:site-specific integrase [Cerasicoccus maritimus]